MSASASPASGHPHVIGSGHTNRAAAAKLALRGGENMEIQVTPNGSNRAPAVQSARETGALLTIREASSWIEVRRGRRPSTSTIYRWTMAGVGGHRLASTIVYGVRHVAEDDLADFCQTHNWPAPPRRHQPATAGKFLRNQMLLPFDWADSSLSQRCGAAQ